MVNEVIMYQSMFLLGIVAFGVFSYSFNIYTERAEELTFDSNIELTTQKVGTLLLQIIAEGQKMEIYSSDFELTIYVYLDSAFARKSYYLELEVDISGEVLINAISSGEQFSSFNTGYINATVITFDTSQILVSDDSGQIIYYRRVGGGISRVGFDALA